MDVDYYYEPIYKQVQRMGQQSIIAYNKRNERVSIRFAKHFSPTYFRGHFYRIEMNLVWILS